MCFSHSETLDNGFHVLWGCGYHKIPFLLHLTEHTTPTLQGQFMNFTDKGGLQFYNMDVSPEQLSPVS